MARIRFGVDWKDGRLPGVSRSIINAPRIAVGPGHQINRWGFPGVRLFPEASIGCDASEIVGVTVRLRIKVAVVAEMIARDRNAEALHTMVLNRAVIREPNPNGPKGAGGPEPVQTPVAPFFGNGGPQGLIVPRRQYFTRGGLSATRPS